MFNKKNLLIGGAVLVGLYLLNPYTGSFRSGEVNASGNKQFEYQTQQLKIINFVGTIEYGTSKDDSIHINVSNIRDGLAPKFDHIGDKLEISNFDNISTTDCNSFSWVWWGNDDETGINISINDGSSQKLDHYPILKILAPNNVSLSLDKSLIRGNFSTLENLNANMTACSQLNIGSVTNDAKITIRGSGDIDIGRVGGVANSNIRGSGNVKIGNIGQDSVSNIRGSGDIEYGHINGIHKMTIHGSGNINVEQINGDAEMRIMGSGDIKIKTGELNWMIANIEGSGSIDYDGRANNRKFNIKGSGDINTNYD